MTSTPTTSALRPLAMGEMIDRSVAFWRGHLKPLFVLSLGYTLMGYIIAKTMVVATQRWTPLLYSPERDEIAKSDPTAMMGQVGLMTALWGGMFVLVIWIYWFAMVATARYVASAQLGTPVSAADGLRRALSQVGPLTGAYLLSLGWACLITLLLVLPGGLMLFGGAVLVAAKSNILGAVLVGVGTLLAVLGVFAAMLWYFLRFLLLPPVLAMEDLGAWAAFKRSGSLLSGRVEPGFLGRVVVRAMILFTVVSLILLSLHFVFTIPSWLVMLPYGSPFDASTLARTPQYLLVPVEILQAVAQAIFSPVNFVFCTLFYLDMRVRREALDLEQRLGAPEPSSPQAA
ncbi:hypothetical protein LZ198_31470 [Myxococcus sp. K15C18031901]|uniref:hypothetical protein n=1 Tax=Myxococcus dinghuensis TaxID=2906761 RepID=UPI0020A72698|nr:hypothetical protein [Myxococcus dinghuensis]MCP3103412.1 hypothetical protein [Myxococcus dinghuensis]